jgi:hypothetical protein
MHGSPAGFPKSPAAVSQSIVLGASRDSAKSHRYTYSVALSGYGAVQISAGRQARARSQKHFVPWLDWRSSCCLAIH